MLAGTRCPSCAGTRWARRGRNRPGFRVGRFLRFMQSMGVDMPAGTRVSQAVYVAINGAWPASLPSIMK